MQSASRFKYHLMSDERMDDDGDNGHHTVPCLCLWMWLSALCLGRLRGCICFFFLLHDFQTTLELAGSLTSHTCTKIKSIIETHSASFISSRRFLFFSFCEFIFLHSTMSSVGLVGFLWPTRSRHKASFEYSIWVPPHPRLSKTTHQPKWK